VIPLLLSFVLALQGIPVQLPQAGTVSGVLKDAQGKPIPGIRMAAIARTESLDEAINSPAMSSLAETDEQGRYTLESVPTGRYFIAAGRLDFQTYYPGTADLALAKEVQITPGRVVVGIDFALGDSSSGRAGPGGSVTIPLRVTMEGGGKMPRSAGGKFISVKLDTGTIVIRTQLTSTTVSVPAPQPAAARVTVENLPEAYVVKSIMYGTTDLLINPLRLTPSNFPGTAALGASLVSFAPQPGMVAPPMTGTALLQLPQDERELLSYLTGLATARGLAPPPGPTRPPASPDTAPPKGLTDSVSLEAYLAGVAAAVAERAVVVSVPQSPQTAPSVLYITLAPVPVKATGGVRVSGRMGAGGNRTVYVSGIPGTVYSDGTFEVYGVPPGRHSIVTQGAFAGMNMLAASVVVENRNLDDIVLAETAMLPFRAWEASPPRPAGGHPGGNVPLARLTGILVEEVSKNPIREGTVNIKANGFYSSSFPVDAEGRFQLPPLLPGAYELEVQVFGHSNINQSIEIDDKDMKLELISRKLY
jgi:hypothetical protein